MGVVKFTLSHGIADIECHSDKDGRTPVMTAAYNGQLTVFDFLVSQSCNLSVIDNDNNNLLHLACLGGNSDIVRKLLESNNFDVEGRGINSETPLLNAAKTGHAAVFEILIAYTCNTTAVDRKDNNILHLACTECQLHIVKYILAKNITGIESKGWRQQTPVLNAAKYCHKGVVEFPVSKGCNLTAVDNYGDDVLHVACIPGNVDVVRYVLGINMTRLDREGRHQQTPVMRAVKHGHSEVVQLLVSKGCNVYAVDEYGDKLLHKACMYANVDMVKYILSLNVTNIENKGYKQQTPVMRAAKHGQIEIVQFLVSIGCNVYAVDKYGDNVLHKACIHGNVDMVKYILNLNVTSIESKNFKQQTPMMRAAVYGKEEVVAFLVDKKCSLTSLDKDNNNILHLASMKGQINVVSFLLEQKAVKGMDKIKNKDGRTPEMLAKRENHQDVVALLKANYSRKN